MADMYVQLITCNDSRTGWGIALELCDLIVVTPCCGVFLTYDRSESVYDCVSCRRKYGPPFARTSVPTRYEDTMLCVKSGMLALTEFIEVWTGYAADEYEMEIGNL